MATLGDLWGVVFIFGTIACVFLLMILKKVIDCCEVMCKIAEKLGEPVRGEIYMQLDRREDDEDDEDEGEEWKKGGLS